MSQPAKIETDARFIEFDSQRKIRHRNKTYYRVLHWPIWIFVFFIAPGPLTFDLFAHGLDGRMLAWLTLVLVATGSAGLRGRLPGASRLPTSSGLPRIGRIRSIGACVTRRVG
jgi:hypothetical protein